MRKSLWTVLAITLLLAAGCAKPPEAELALAKEKRAAAEVAEAADYASAELQQVKDTLAQAEAEIQAQAGKNAFSRSYKSAKELLAQVVTLSDSAAAAAATNKTKAAEDANAAVASINDSLTRATEALTALQGCRRKPKDFAADLEALQGSLTAFQTRSGDVTTAIGSGKYRAALDQANALTSELQTLLNDLEGARQKTGC